MKAKPTVVFHPARKIASAVLSSTGLILLGVGVTLSRLGVPLLSSITYLAYWLLVIALPGRFIWQWLMMKHGAGFGGSAQFRTKLEDWVCGAAIGYSLEVPSYVIARALQVPRAYLIVPVVVLFLWMRFWRRERTLPPPIKIGAAPAWTLGGVTAFFFVWMAVGTLAIHPLGGGRLVDVDEAFHLSLVGELRHHFPATYPFMEYPGRLTYQWFVHAHMAASTWATGLPSEMVYRRFDPLVLSVLAVLGVAVIAWRLNGRPWIGPIAAAILVLVGSFDITGARVGGAAPEERFPMDLVIMHSPTQTFALALAIPVVIICHDVARRGFRIPVSSWVALAWLMGMLAGSKVTFLPMFLCGFIAVLLFSAVHNRRVHVQAMIGMAVVVLVILASGWLIYAGDTQSLKFAPGQTARLYMRASGMSGGAVAGQIVVSAALLVMWLMPAVGLVGLLAHSKSRLDPRVWWLLGVVSSGYGATVLLGHGGNSQLYFGRSASLLVAVLSAWGITSLYPPGTTRRSAVVAAVTALAGGLSLLGVRLMTEQWRTPILTDGKLEPSPVLRLWINLPVFLIIVLIAYVAHVLVRDVTRGRRNVPLRLVVVFLVGLGLARSLAFVLSHTEQRHATKSSFGLAGRQAAEWLALNSSPDDRVVTNAHCGPVVPSDDPCDARHFWMSGLSERRFVLEGWAYTPKSENWTGDFWGDPRLLAENDRLFTHPSQPRLTRFVTRHGAQWLFVDDRFGVDQTALRTLKGVVPVFANGHYSIYAIK